MPMEIYPRDLSEATLSCRCVPPYVFERSGQQIACSPLRTTNTSTTTHAYCRLKLTTAGLPVSEAVGDFQTTIENKHVSHCYGFRVAHHRQYGYAEQTRAIGIYHRS